MNAAVKTQLAEVPQVPPPPANNYIDDVQFMQDLAQLKALRSFLTQQAVPLGPDAMTLRFGELNLLRKPLLSNSGRSPTDAEWQKLEDYTQKLYRYLPDNLRHQFVSGQVPTWVAYVAVGCGVLAFASLLLAFTTVDLGFRLMWHVAWLASLGAVGSIVFIGMNALSVQNDATFDITNTKLMILRISVGALFAVVLALPFGFKSFLTFLNTLKTGGAAVDSGLALDSVLLLLPFILGFSTSLVIMILNQFIDAIQSFFGKKSTPAPAKAGTVTG